MHDSINIKTFIDTYWHITLVFSLLLCFLIFMLLRLNILNRQLRLAEQHLLQSNQQLKGMTVIDGLTGVGNRRKLTEFLQHNWGRVCRSGTPVCVMLLDIDYFKDYNDNYGHIAGDECLKKIARTISHMFRRTGELVIRYGGEEFLVMILNCDISENHAQAEALRQDIEMLSIEHSRSSASSVVTVSIGLATIRPDKNTTAEELILMADQALYKAKQSGRNRVVTIE
jgi:diguanylate cyclase (GGDEF)-like protein